MGGIKPQQRKDVISAMIQAGITDEELRIPSSEKPRTGTQYQKALDKKAHEIFERIESITSKNDTLKGNMPYSAVRRMVEFASQGERVIARTIKSSDTFKNGGEVPTVYYSGQEIDPMIKSLSDEGLISILRSHKHVNIFGDEDREDLEKVLQVNLDSGDIDEIEIITVLDGEGDGETFKKGGEIGKKPDRFKVDDLVIDSSLGHGKVIGVSEDDYDVIFWDGGRKSYLVTNVKKSSYTMQPKTGKYYDGTGNSFDGSKLFTEERIAQYPTRDIREKKFALGGEIELSTEESERLDYLQKREDQDILTKDENQEYESLVEKYRKTSKYKGNKAGQFVSHFDSTKQKMQDKTQQERIDALIEFVGQSNWSSKTITVKDNMVIVFSKMYDLEPTRVAAIFNKYQKPYGVKYKEGGEIDGNERVTTLFISSKNPLSTQLTKLTGDSYNSGDFEDIQGGSPNAGYKNIIKHRATGKLFTTLNQDDLDKLGYPQPKHKLGENISIIDAPKSSTNNYEVVGHERWNPEYGWETTIKNDSEKVTMYENLLEPSEKQFELGGEIIGADNMENTDREIMAEQFGANNI